MRNFAVFRRPVCVLLSLLMIAALLAPAALAAESGGGTIAAPAETVSVQSGEAVRESSFNEGWKFYLGTSSTAQNVGFDDSGWSSVNLPHDFSITQSFTTTGEAESGFLPGGTGWYRKTFTLPESYAGKTLLLNFDGVYANAYVYVNGTLVGENHYGYTAFAFDITDYITCNGATENVVAVKAVNTIPSSRWYSGSGIYRDVTLIAADPVHVDWNGTYVTTPDIATGTGTVQVQVDVVNDGASDATVTVTNTVVETGDSASTTVNVEAGATATATASPVVANPSRWSPDSPDLYTVRTTLTVDDVEVDSYDTTFGFRWYSFDSTGFHLNGKAVKLNGVCLHHDQGALGSAAYYDAMYRQLSIMKDMGVNAIRTSHNPADEDFIDICNQLGLMVIEEAFDGWSAAKNGNSYDFSQYFSASLGSDNHIYGGNSAMTWAEYAIKSVVKRDRNDPSVILWSLGNEITEGTTGGTSNYPTIAQSLIDWVKAVDTSRPTTIGDNTRGGNATMVSVLNTIRNNGGIVGFNYANSASSLHSLAQNYGGVIIASETSSAVNSRGIYSSQGNATNADGKYHLTSYDTSAVSWGITAHESIYNTYQYDCVAGEFVWTGFDYIGEPTPWNGTGSGSVSYAGAIPNSSYFGIVETTGFEKDTYYLYRSQWNQKETTLHLVTAWDDDNMLTTDGKTPVVIYSNAPVVKLYRNGELIGTATRTAHTTDAEHTYYTYTTASNNDEICTAVSASGSASLYATFHVTYEEGTISAKAFEEDGTTEILLTGNSGSSSVSTPGTPAQLRVTQNETVIDADGSSLAYIAVDVTDAKGNLDTTASNTISFTLTGNGEIVGVDNGDQATTAKYQQSSVLTSATSAHIAAYAGKALVIVRSTKDAGSFTVNVSADGLSSGSATVTTRAVDDGTTADGLTSYTMVRDYTVKAGTAPELETTATGIVDGETVSGEIAWETVGSDIYNVPGDHTIRGTLTIGETSVNVTARLHVIANVVALRNISTVTTPNSAPALPTVVSGVQADGTLSGEFPVTWEAVNASAFETVGQLVTVSGTAAIFGEETLPVTCTVRVAEAVNTESTNVAPSASSLTQDIASDKQSDNLESIRNGTTKPGDNTNERWTNWNNRTTSATATLTFRWDTAQLLSSVNLYYYYDSCSAKPESVVFKYSLNGSDYAVIEATEALVESYSLGAEYTFTFAHTINPVALQIVFTQQDGTTGTHCVGVTEAEIMTFAGQLEYNSSAALSAIYVNETAIDGFDPDVLEYTASGETVTAATDVNAGITILPALENVVRILTISEDGSASRTYAVTLNGETPCKHENTEIRNAKKATCTEDGYTGDIYCVDCGALLESGEVIPATGHTWDEGKVTKEPTETEEGVKTYTCTVCGETRTEAIPKLTVEKAVPTVTVSAARASSGTRITLTGTFTDYLNSANYYNVTAHGLVYYSTSKLGTKNLTVNTAGRTKVSFTGYKDDGSFSYTMTPAFASTRYTVRAFLAYTDANGRTMYVYSDPIIVSYNSLN